MCTTRKRLKRTIARSSIARRHACLKLAHKLRLYWQEKMRRTEQAMADYGRHLGTAFQLVDDALDYDASAEELGKNIGDDLAEGKATLPLIYAMHHCDGRQRALIREAIIEGGLEHLVEITEIIRKTGALEYTAEKAAEAAALAVDALSVLSDSPCKQALLDLAAFSVQRRT